MPVTDVFLPFHVQRTNGAVGQQLAGGLNGRRLARMPGCKQRNPLLLCQLVERENFRDRRARRLLQHHMFAGEKGRACLLEPTLRRRAQRDRIHLHVGCEQRVDVRKTVDIVQLGVAAGHGNEIDPVRGFDCLQMLVPGDLAETDNGETNGGHRRLLTASGS